jgi:hypothetical protein
LKGNLVPVLFSSGTLTSGSASVSVPVDSTVESVTFSVSIDVKGAINVLRPSGATVSPTDPGVTITELSSGRVVTVATPETGQWQLQVGGSGSYSAQVQANSSIQFNSFDFVELTGRPFHEGLFPIAGQPVTGGSQTGLAALLGPFSTASFTLVDQSGNAIQPVSLAQGNPDAAADEFVGAFTPPTVPFRVSASGQDKNGLPYQRLFPSSFKAQPVKVTPDTTTQSLPSGATTRLTFTLQNLGSDSTFQVIAADDHNFITNVQPTLVTLAGGASAPISIDVTVPAGVPDGTNIFITATATSTSDSTISNSAVLSLPVGSSNRPPDCAAAQGISISLWPPDHTMVPIDILAATNITDPDGDPVTIVINSITQDEPVFGPGDGAGNTAPDGAGIGTGVAMIRAERDGDGNGRVYKINYTASDDKGASCQGTLTVTVPHSQNGSPAIDDGQNFDSTQTPTSAARRKASRSHVARSLHAKTRIARGAVAGAS